MGEVESTQKRIFSELERVAKPPWEVRGINSEQYMIELTENLKGTLAVLTGESKSLPSLKDTITQTAEFLTWAHMKKELHSTKALITALSVKEQNDGRAKRVDQGR